MSSDMEMRMDNLITGDQHVYLEMRAEIDRLKRDNEYLGKFAGDIAAAVGTILKLKAELAEVKTQRDRLLLRLRETDQCLADVASLKGGWAWEDVLRANTALFDEIEVTKEKP